MPEIQGKPFPSFWGTFLSTPRWSNVWTREWSTKQCLQNESTHSSDCHAYMHHISQGQSRTHTESVHLHTQKRRARQIIHIIASIQLITFFYLHISYITIILSFFFFHFIAKEFQKVLYYFSQLTQTSRDFFFHVWEVPHSLHPCRPPIHTLLV